MLPFLRSILLFGLLLVLTGKLLAQASAPDALYRLDQTMQKVKIDEMTATDVFYREAASPNAPKRIRKADLWKIVFSDGSTDVFNQPKAMDKSTAAPAPTRPTTTSTTDKALATTRSGTTSPTTNETTVNTVMDGQQSVSLSPSFTGLLSRDRVNKKVDQGSISEADIDILVQRFTKKYTTIGGYLTLGLRREIENPSDDDKALVSTVAVSIGALFRQYLPISSKLAAYGLGKGGLAFGWYKAKYGNVSGRDGLPATVMALGAVGLKYSLAAQWSLDLNKELIDFKFHTGPGSQLSVSGATSWSDFRIYLTHYF